MNSHSDLLFDPFIFENLPPSASYEALLRSQSKSTRLPIDNYETASPFEVLFLFCLLVVSLPHTTCTDIYNICGAGAWTWVSINPSCGQALPGATGHADFGSNGGHPREYKPPTRKKTIHVWECCQCGRGNLNILLEQCPDCEIYRCSSCKTTRVSVRQ